MLTLVTATRKRGCEEIRHISAKRSLLTPRLVAGLTISVVQAHAVDTPMPFVSGQGSGGTRNWIPTTCDRNGGVGTCGATNIRYSSSRSADADRETALSLRSEKQVLAPHGGIPSRERERVGCWSHDEVTQTLARPESHSSSAETEHVDPDTIGIGNRVFARNLSVVGGELLRRMGASRSCADVPGLSNDTVLQVIGGPLRAKGCTWRRLDGPGSWNGLTVEAPFGVDRQAFSSSPVQLGQLAGEEPV